MHGRNTVATKETTRRRDGNKHSPPAKLGGKMFRKKKEQRAREREETIRHEGNRKSVFDTTVSKLRLATDIRDVRERGEERERNTEGGPGNGERRRTCSIREGGKKP